MTPRPRNCSTALKDGRLGRSLPTAFNKTGRFGCESDHIPVAACSCPAFEHVGGTVRLREASGTQRPGGRGGLNNRRLWPNLAHPFTGELAFSSDEQPLALVRIYHDSAYTILGLRTSGVTEKSGPGKDTMMQPKALLFLIAGSACAALAQVPPLTVERAFPFAQTDSPQSIQEMVNSFRVIAGISQASVDPGMRVATVQGSAGQVAVVEWLFNTLEDDKPGAAMQEYVLPDSDNDVVRVFRPSNVGTPQQSQEMINCLRSLGEIEKITAFWRTKAVIVRGRVWQAQVAGWLVNALDSPAPGQSSAACTIPGSDPNGERAPLLGDPGAVRVLYLGSTTTIPALQETLAQVRKETHIPRTVAYTAQRAIAIRGTQVQVARAEQVASSARKLPAAGWWADPGWSHGVFTESGSPHPPAPAGVTPPQPETPSARPSVP